MSFCYRWLPFEACDIPQIETWLTKCARKGRKLCSCMGNFAKFEKTDPSPARYRLDPIQQKSADVPEKAMLALYAAAGWDYVARFGEFYIFCAVDPHAQELHTDDSVLAYAMRRQIRSAVLSALIITAFVAAWFFWLFFRLFRSGTPLLEWIGSGTLSTLYVIAMLLLLAAVYWVNACRLLRFRRKLRKGTFRQQASYRGAMAWHSAVLLLTLCALLAMPISRLLRPQQEEFICSAYTGALPFLQLAEMEGTDSFRYDSFYLDGINHEDYIRCSHDFLAPLTLTARQYGSSLEASDCSLKVQFYSCRTVRIAEEILKELQTEVNKDNTGERTALQLAGMDSGLFLQAADSTQFLFLQSGTQVIRIAYTGSGSLASFAQAFAEQLLAFSQ